MAKAFKFCIVIQIIMLLSQFEAVAVGSYYTEDDYKRTSTYASVNDNSRKNTITSKSGKRNIKSSSKVIQDGNTKKIYTTIIVKSKKNKNQTSVAPVPAPKKQIPEVTVKPVNEKHKDEDFFSSKKKSDNNIFKKIFLKETPDKFYTYALLGYSVSLSNTLKINAMSGSKVDNDFPTLSSSAAKKGVGFNFIVGSKIYLNNNKFAAVFVAPEFFYNKMNGANEGEFNYNSKHMASTIPVGEQEPQEVSVETPTKMSVQTRDMFGGSVRLGFTMLNTVSLFGKASIGGTRYRVKSSLDFNNTDWAGAGISDPDAQQEIIDEQWTDQSSRYYINTKDGSSLSKTILTYGLGFGVELNFFNQHLIVRADQDWWFGSGTFLSGSLQQKSTSELRFKFLVSFKNITPPVIDDLLLTTKLLNVLILNLQLLR